MLNKTTFLILFLFQLMILTTAQATVFTTIQTPNNGETKVVNILDAYFGLSNLTRVSDSQDITWGSAQGTLTGIRVIGKQADLNNIFGITKTDGTDFIGLISAGVIEDSIIGNESINISNVAYSDYLLAILTPENNLFSSDPTKNTDNQFDHMVTWNDNNDANHYFVGFEDLFKGGDKDYNDVVLELNFSNNNTKITVPEPNIIALLGLGLVAFGLSARRRKQNS